MIMQKVGAGDYINMNVSVPRVLGPYTMLLKKGDTHKPYNSPLP